MQKEFFYLGKKISYNVYGKGSPILLLHGFGEDSNIFNLQVEFLKQYCLLIVPDLPGSGKSEYNEQLEGIEDFAKAFHALMQQENISQFIISGHSMGGYISLAYANLFADKLKGIGLIHSTALADDDEKKQVRQKGIDFIEKGGGNLFLKGAIPTLFGEKFKKEHFEKISALIENSSKSISEKALQQYYKIMIVRPDTTNVLRKITVPVLFIIGTEDKAAPLETLQQQINLPAKSFVHILDKTGHMSMLENPDLLNKYLLEFIKQVN